MSSSPLPPLPARLFIPPRVDRKEDILEVELPPRKRLCLTAPISRYEVGESSTAAPRPTGGHRADYRDVWVDPTEAVEEVAPTTLEGVNARVTELAVVQEQDTQDIYDVIKDGQDRQTQLFQRVDGLVEDRQFHYETARLLDRDFITTGTVFSGIGTYSGTSGWRENNMPPRRSSAIARAAAAVRAAAAAATPMIAAAVEQLIEARVSAALATHETL
ncbi:hypothetical protein Tco_0676906 [Tanacetum coccineum]